MNRLDGLHPVFVKRNWLQQKEVSELLPDFLLQIVEDCLLPLHLDAAAGGILHFKFLVIS